MNRIPVVLFALALAACAHQPPRVAPGVADHRALDVYRAIAESIYVNSTGRVIAVATTPLDTGCARTRCDPLSSRWGLDPLWWARGDTSAAIAARDDLLARAGRPLPFTGITTDQPMLLDTDPGDVPSVDADVAEWSRFRTTHADAAGALRISPVGFSPSGKSAIAFVDWRCGPTCGHTLGVSLTATTDSTWAISEMLLLSSRK
jgi:hypothetical protein